MGNGKPLRNSPAAECKRKVSAAECKKALAAESNPKNNVIYSKYLQEQEQEQKQEQGYLCKRGIFYLLSSKSMQRR
jgi:hypothetical protein